MQLMSNIDPYIEQQRSAEDIFSGLTSYADIVFHITSFTVEGDTIKLTGDLCNSGFVTKEYLMTVYRAT